MDAVGDFVLSGFVLRTSHLDKRDLQEDHTSTKSKRPRHGWTEVPNIT